MAARGRGGHNFIASFYDLWESCVLLCVYATLEPSPARGRTLLFFFPSIATRKFPSLSLSRFPFQFHAPLRLLQASRYETVARLLRVTTVSNLMRVGKISYFFFSYQTFAYIRVDGVFTIFVKASYRDERERRKVGGGSMKGRKSKRRRIRLVRFRVGGK